MNLTTNPGEIAKLGFSFLRFGIQGTVSLSPGEYRVRTNFTHIQDAAGALHGISLTVWGVPAEHSHDLMRGLNCDQEGCLFYSTETEGSDARTQNGLEDFPEGQSVTTPLVPYLTSPTDCTSEPLEATITANSWEEPEREVERDVERGPDDGLQPAGIRAGDHGLPGYGACGHPGGLHVRREDGPGRAGQPELRTRSRISRTRR